MFDNVVKTGRLRNSAKEPTITGVEAATSAHHPRPTLLRSASCSCGGDCPLCQAKDKLNVSHPNDPAEIEADAIADRVMTMQGVEAREKKSASATLAKTKPATINRKPLALNASSSPQNPAHVSRAIGSGGQPLDRPTRNFFEPRFGYDLRSVRIHVGSQADESAKNSDAKAYTLGSDIVFGKGQYNPESDAGKRLLAHELAHVVQYDSSSKINRQTIYRQPTEDASLAVSRIENGDGTWSALNARGEVICTGPLGPVIDPGLPNLYETVVAGNNTSSKICVPGSPAYAPECVAARNRQKKIENDRKPGTEVVVTTPNMTLPAGAGFKVPAHPDAVKGVHDWTNVFGTANSANNHNKFRVGSMRLQQICQPDTAGAWAVYVYYVTDSNGDNYAVGPDSLMSFVMTHGMIIMADTGNTDELGGGKKMLDPRKLPAAPGAFDEEPTIYYAAPKLAPYDEVSDAFHVGYYSIRGYLRRGQDGTLSVLYYVAENMISLHRPEYVIGPRWIDLFCERQGGYGLVAEFSYPMEPGAMPSAYQIHSARFVLGTMKGDVERAESGLEAWKSAAKDPGWWLQVGMAYAGAAQPVRPSTPNLQVIKGGGGGGIAPRSNVSVTNTGVNTGSVPYVGRGGAAPVMATETASALPAQVPRPGPVGVPGWNPNPMPVAPVKPISPPASMFGVGASSSLGTGLGLGPDVDFDLDKERRRGPCTYESVGQQFGRYPCHAAYATSLSGVSREVRVRTPERLSADFDAMDSGRTLYEVKTGYRWMVFVGSNEARAEIIQRFYRQATEQLLIAERCGHPLNWYFNDPYVASFFGAENAPYPDYFEVGLPVPVWYVPFNCDQDSG